MITFGYFVDFKFYTMSIKIEIFGPFLEPFSLPNKLKISKLCFEVNQLFSKVLFFNFDENIEI